MEQGPDNDVNYEDNDESIMKQTIFEEEENEKDERNMISKKVDGRVRLLKKLDGRVRILKRSGRGIRSLAARLNGRTKLFKRPNQMFWVV
jgi:hypothetical protein